MALKRPGGPAQSEVRARLGGVHAERALPRAADLHSRGQLSHADATLYILYGESLMKYTGGRQNDFNVHG